MRVSWVILALGNMTLPQCNKSLHCTLQQSIFVSCIFVWLLTRQVQLTEAIVLASHASRPIQLDPVEAHCLPLHQCKYATHPMNVQCSVFCSFQHFWQHRQLTRIKKAYGIEQFQCRLPITINIIGLATKNLTKILTKLLKRPFLHVSVACNDFRGKLQIPQCNANFYMLWKTGACQSAHPQCTAECSPSLKQMLLQLWQNDVTLNTHCNVR